MSLYKFIIGLGSPMASGNPVVHADGPLQYAKALEEIGRDGIEELNPEDSPEHFDLPVRLQQAQKKNAATRSWVWRCSALHPVVDGSTEWNATKWRKRFDTDHDHQQKETHINVTAGKFKSYNASLPYTHASRLFFFADTESPERVVELLDSLKGLGKKTSQGYGRIQGVDYEESCVDPVVHEGKTLRNIPSHFFSELPSRQTIKRVGVRPPYWHHENIRPGIQGFTDLNEEAQKLYETTTIKSNQ